MAVWRVDKDILHHKLRRMRNEAAMLWAAIFGFTCLGLALVVMERRVSVTTAVLILSVVAALARVLQYYWQRKHSAVLRDNLDAQVEVESGTCRIRRPHREMGDEVRFELSTIRRAFLSDPTTLSLHFYKAEPWMRPPFIKGVFVPSLEISGLADATRLHRVLAARSGASARSRLARHRSARNLRILWMVLGFWTIAILAVAALVLSGWLLLREIPESIFVWGIMGYLLLLAAGVLAFIESFAMYRRRLRLRKLEVRRAYRRELLRVASG